MFLLLESSLPFPSDSPKPWELWEEEKVQETRSASLLGWEEAEHAQGSGEFC